MRPPKLFWGQAASLLFFSLTANATVASKCLEPFKQALEEQSKSSSSSLPSSAIVPVECQYYEVNDLDKDLQQEVLSQFRRIGKPVMLDTKLSEAFGLLKISVRVGPPELARACDLSFKKLQSGFIRLKDRLSGNEITRVECGDMVKDYDDSTDSKPPPDCDRTYNESDSQFKKFVQQLVSDVPGKATSINGEKPLADAYKALKANILSALKKKCDQKKI